MTCVYGPALTYAFTNPLITAYRHSVIQVSLISVLDETEPNSSKQGHLRAQKCATLLIGKVRDPELIVLNFRGQLQFRMEKKMASSD